MTGWSSSFRFFVSTKFISVLAHANLFFSLPVVQAYWLEFEIEFRVNAGYGFPRFQTYVKSMLSGLAFLTDKYLYTLYTRQLTIPSTVLVEFSLFTSKLLSQGRK